MFNAFVWPIRDFIQIREEQAYIDHLDLIILNVLCDNFFYEFDASTLRLLARYLRFLGPSLDGVES